MNYYLIFVDNLIEGWTTNLFIVTWYQRTYENVTVGQFFCKTIEDFIEIIRRELDYSEIDFGEGELEDSEIKIRETHDGKLYIPMSDDEYLTRIVYTDLSINRLESFGSNLLECIKLSKYIKNQEVQNFLSIFLMQYYIKIIEEYGKTTYIPNELVDEVAVYLNTIREGGMEPCFQ